MNDEGIFSLLRKNGNWRWALISSGGRGSPRDGQVPQSARLELINDPVHPQVLPAACPSVLHGPSSSNVLDLRAHARLDDLRQRLGIGYTLEIERPCERSEWREPAREGRRRFGLGGICRHGFEARRGTSAIRVADDEN